ncbi:MAG: SUMF1/EgtB/PvdO family nonheme iron enzyme [Candidatus Delongbacteria bacterium]|nr:SUMF1/EgtB/PvdO family nonheme iron enzyme [Candidatus Delongbacteria bacterium]
MICPNCNTMNPNSIKKCIKCGAKLEKSSGGPALKQSASTGGPMLKQKPEKAPKPMKAPKPQGEKKGNTRLLILLLMLAVVLFFGWKYYGDQIMLMYGFNEGDSLMTPVDSLEAPQDSTVLLYSELKKSKQDTTLYKTLSDAEKAQLNKKRRSYTDKFYYSKQDNKKMMLIKGHSFKMGSDKGSELERPQHTAKAIDFYMDETEVTNSQFSKFLTETGYKPKGSLSKMRDRRFNQPDQPVVDIEYDDAVAYATWAEKRLPTEIEWECAAKDSHNYVYPTGKDMTDKEARFGLNITIGYPMPVKSYKPNGFGLYDMAGNVSEWVHGVIFAYPGNETFSRYFGKIRVPRGGSWLSSKEDCKTYRRAILDISQSTGNIGFRCAISKNEIENLINK